MTPISVMSGSLGDIFWDLPPWITYAPGFDLGCTIYVANPAEAEKEYALMARLTRGETVLSEESLPVFGYAWFKVAPGDFSRLRGALRFPESDADLAVLLVERESQEVTDSATVRLVAPQAAGALPPTWPSPDAPGASTDWSSLLFMAMPLLMVGMVAATGRSKNGPEEKKRVSAEKQAATWEGGKR